MAISAVLGVTLVTLVAEALLQPVAAPAGRTQLEHVLLSAVLAAFVVNGVVLLWHRRRSPIGVEGVDAEATYDNPVGIAWMAATEGSVDRRFNCSSHDAARTVGAHSSSLRDEVASAVIVTGPRATTAGTFGAWGVGVVVTGGGAA